VIKRDTLLPLWLNFFYYRTKIKLEAKEKLWNYA